MRDREPDNSRPVPDGMDFKSRLNRRIIVMLKNRLSMMTRSCPIPLKSIVNAIFLRWAELAIIPPNLLMCDKEVIEV